jgi:hypothetical protein
MTALTPKERAALKSYWKMPVRVKNGNVELYKRSAWGILCSIEEGKKNAKMIIDKVSNN